MKIFSVILFLLLFFCDYLITQEIDITDIYDQNVYLFEQNKWEEALEGFKQVAKINPEYKKVSKYLDKSKKKLSKSHYKLGINLYQQGRWEDAIVKFEESIKFNPKYTKARLWRNHSKKKISKFYYECGEKFYKKGKWEDAISNLEMSIKYGNYNVQRKEWILKRISRAKKDVAIEFYDKGFKLYNKGDFLEAEEHFLKVLSYNKNHTEAKKYLDETKGEITKEVKEYYLQGLKEYDQGNIEKAIHLWEKVLKYDPAHMNVQTSLKRAREEVKKK